MTDARGRFHLADLAGGLGRRSRRSPPTSGARAPRCAIAPGETTRDVRFSLVAEAAGALARACRRGEPRASRSARRGDPPEVVVVAVAEGSEAERAGVAPGDAIVSVGGEPVATMADARAKMSGPLGDDVLLTVRRARPGDGDAPRAARAGHAR